MVEYFHKVSLGLDILFGNSAVNVGRKKSVDTKKELRMAKTIKKTSVIQRSANRLQRIARRALG